MRQTKNLERSGCSHLSQNLADPHHMVAQNSTKPSWLRKANAPSLPQWSQDLVFSRRSRWGFSQVSFGTGGGNPCDKKTQILEGYWSQAFSKVRKVRFWVGEVWFQVSLLCMDNLSFGTIVQQGKKSTHTKHHATGQEHVRIWIREMSFPPKVGDQANSFYSQLIASKNNQTISKKQYHIISHTDAVTCLL